ncbi:helix-turn-helix domain-containing protein [Halalkalibacterium ligniniphilum]|uniref:helix-turn-helix domain-containing protein n=1 Tax=Halalkalibacterium ligniniphilum TaxID=1134413 RepID=UPI00034C8234|nr:XRE family transcriptional regulator [Halalkalibacterium ligniniphilum]
MNKEQLSRQIGRRLKAIRTERKWSLDRLSQETGVSKPMLGQIERGESNPTVSTLWKIAKGLDVSFTAFLEEERPKVTVVRRSQVEPLREGEAFHVYTLFPRTAEKPVELFSVLLEPGCRYFSEAHADGVEEYIIVDQGSLTVFIDKKPYSLEAGDGLHFKADQPHEYMNESKEEACTLTLLIYYSTNWGIK